MARDGGNSLICPECKASNRPGSAACFLCGRRLDGGLSKPTTHVGTRSPASSADFTNPYAVAEAPRAAGHGFRLNSLLLVIALIAVCLGVIREAPGLGVPLAVVSSIALTRTMMVSESRGRVKQPLSAVEKLAVFFATISMVFVVLFCLMIALFATCYAVLVADSGPSLIWVLGIPVVLFVVALMILGSWRLMGYLRQVASIRRDKPGDGQRRP